MWHEVGKIIKDNQKIQKQSLFYDWITANYTVQIGIIIRRLAESKRKWEGQNKDTISLWRLLDDIRKNPEVISRDYFYERYEGSNIKNTNVPQNEFNKFAEPGAECISDDLICNDLKSIEFRTKNITNYVDKRIAHYDEPDEWATKLPTYEEADEVIELLQKITEKYRKLIPNDLFLGLLTITDNWKEPLRHAWIEN